MNKLSLLTLAGTTIALFSVRCFRETNPSPQTASAQVPVTAEDETNAPKTFVMPLIHPSPVVSSTPSPVPKRVAQPVQRIQVAATLRCSGDERSNPTSIYQGRSTGNTRIVPLPGKGAARVRISPKFGSNVFTCLLPTQTAETTGDIQGIWSQVRLGNGSTGWISTSQLRN